MSGTITFTVSGGIAQFYLDSIINITTDGAGVLKLNIAGTTEVFTFTAVDEGAARRIAALIVSLKASNATGSFTIGSTINYATPVALFALLFYDPANNNWYVSVIGSNFTNVQFIGFNGSSLAVDAGNSSSTLLRSETFSSPPPYGTYLVTVMDAAMSVLATTPVGIRFYYTIQTYLPNPFHYSSDTVTVNGTNFDAAHIGFLNLGPIVGVANPVNGTYISMSNSGGFPTPFAGDFVYASGAGVYTGPYIMYYGDNTNVKFSNCIPMATLTA